VLLTSNVNLQRSSRFKQQSVPNVITKYSRASTATVLLLELESGRLAYGRNGGPGLEHRTGAFKLSCGLARAIKNNEKKGRPLKFFIHRSKLQTGTSDDDGHRESQLIGGVTRPRPKRAFRPIGAAKTAGVQREEAETRTGICVLSFLGNASLQFGTVDEEF
jgi:hypothetical protein